MNLVLSFTTVLEFPMSSCVTFMPYPGLASVNVWK
jgi:hypothetical protein